MTDNPGDGQAPQDPNQPPNPPGQQPGYWEQQQSQPPQYGQPQYGQPPYGQVPYGQPPAGYAPDHPKATTALVLGILGIVICGVIAPFAWRIGKKTLDEIDASNGQLGGRGSAQAGYVLGIVGTILLGLGLLFGVGLLVLAIIGGISSSTSTY
jgi:hypothetical protein